MRSCKYLKPCAPKLQNFLILLKQALVETPSTQSTQKRAELLEEQRLQMEEKRRKKEEAARIARQQEFEEESRLEVILGHALLCVSFLSFHLCNTAGARGTQTQV
jgi:hypothetical protein